MIVLVAFVCCGTTSAQLPKDSVRHLLDFSSEKATIYVDPILDLSYGVGCAGAIWRNVRGASFSAAWDEHWTSWGSLEEHQSIRVLEESWWIAQNRSLPGWGRTKIGRNNTLNSPDTMYVDVARAMGALNWHQSPTTRLGWSVQFGMSPFAWGISDRASTLGLSSTSAPAPELKVARASENGVLWTGLTKWVLDTQTPQGASSGRLWEWTNSAMIGWDLKLTEKLLLRSLVGTTWSAHPERSEDRWASRSGWTGLGMKWSERNIDVGMEGAQEMLDWRAGSRSDWTFGAWRWLAEVKCSVGPVRVGGTIFRREGSSAEWAADPAAFSMLTHAGLPLGQIWSEFAEFSIEFTSPSEKLFVDFYQQYTDWGPLTKTKFSYHVGDDWPILTTAGMRWSSAADCILFEMGFLYNPM
jgi:hypothetical protein